MSVCKYCGGPLPADRHYTEFCTGAHYKRHLRRDTEYGDRDRAASRAWKDRNREANRARDRSYIARLDVRGRCTTCGGPMGISVAHDGTCAGCIASAAEERRCLIVALYEEGVPLQEIAERLGTTRNALSPDLDHLRKAGRIGYRHAGWADRAAA